jgi:hypothetical protein
MSSEPDAVANPVAGPVAHPVAGPVAQKMSLHHEERDAACYGLNTVMRWSAAAVNGPWVLREKSCRIKVLLTILPLCNSILKLSRDESYIIWSRDIVKDV